ncbi:PREDICTED: very long-chain acyl-CoA synthetase-like [Thamnophis sirtalis]|uniref:Long-chain-fatty-acid--CoA ligase n=1 Tax=Thamnophis sirtalis TaxID=35019 RepID=A0A6I9X8G5_9SAUR|nr:PREDICTED: very long-chain acyl-CoA synthetase-like [Thamnophis sirtalis]
MLDLYTAVLGLLILLPMVGRFFFPYFWLDLKNIIAYLVVGYRCHRYMQSTPPITLLEIFLAKVKKYSNKPLILFEDEVYSYQDIDRYSNQIARVLKDYVGLKEEDTIAVFFKTSPSYLSVFIGLSKIGCTMACINYNIRLKSLIHALKTCKAKVLLSTPDLKDAIEDVLPTLNDEGICVFYLSDDSPTEGVEPLLKQIKLSSAESVPFSFRANVTAKSVCLYIFTSGTTGLPKAATISQKKAIMGSHLFYLSGVHNKDVVYCPLPLYHSAGFLGLVATINRGRHKRPGTLLSIIPFWFVPGHEGKIGMAAIRLKDGCPFDGKKLFIHTKDYLPSYAIPRFIRIQEKLEITGTFKQCKTQLVSDGFNPATISDPLFFLDDSEKNYIPLTEEIYCSILENKRKL